MLLEKIETLSDSQFLLHFSGDVTLRCGPAELLDFSLRPGLNLDQADYERLADACAYYQAKQKAASLLALRAMSAGELMRKLKDKGIAEEHARKAADWLLDLGILDEAEYARMVVRHYAGKGYGQRRIVGELYRHLVPREEWDQALADLPEPDEKLDTMVTMKLLGKTADQDTLRKLAASLQRLGYGWEDVRGAIARYRAKNEDRDE